MNRLETKKLADGDRGAIFDELDAIGGEIQDVGKQIRRSAVAFPATREWIIEDLQRLGRFVQVKLRAIKATRKL